MSYLDYEFYKYIGEQLKNARVIRKYSLEEVGLRIGKTKKTIQRYETGEIRIDIEILDTLCKILDIDCGELLKKARIMSLDVYNSDNDSKQTTVLTIASKNIQFLRKQRGWELDDLAKQIGSSKSIIQMWETGSQTPRMEIIQSLSKLFDVDINTFIYVDIETGAKSRDGYYDTSMIPSNITSLEEAMRLIVENPSVAFYGGYDLDKMTDDEKIEFANQIADSIKFFAKRYKK